MPSLSVSISSSMAETSLPAIALLMWRAKSKTSERDTLPSPFWSNLACKARNCSGLMASSEMSWSSGISSSSWLITGDNVAIHTRKRHQCQRNMANTRNWLRLDSKLLGRFCLCCLSKSWRWAKTGLESTRVKAHASGEVAPHAPTLQKLILTGISTNKKQTRELAIQSESSPRLSMTLQLPFTSAKNWAIQRL